MKWIITKDFINAAQMGLEAWTQAGNGEVGRNPTDQISSDARLREYASELGHEFRLLDGDLVEFFAGSCSAPDIESGSDVFAPLDVVGESYGAVSIEFRKKGSREWHRV